MWPNVQIMRTNKPHEPKPQASDSKRMFSDSFFLLLALQDVNEEGIYNMVILSSSLHLQPSVCKEKGEEQLVSDIVRETKDYFVLLVD